MKWTKPNGVEIETNDSTETVAYCRSLGWKPTSEAKTSEAKTSEAKTSEPKPRGRPKKVTNGDGE